MGNIPYSVLIPRGVLEFKIDNEYFWEEAQWYVPKKDADIVLYCKKETGVYLQQKHCWNWDIQT